MGRQRLIGVSGQLLGNAAGEVGLNASRRVALSEFFLLDQRAADQFAPLDGQLSPGELGL